MLGKHRSGAPIAKNTTLQPQQALKSGSMARGRQTKDVQVQTVQQSSTQHAVDVAQQQPHLRACRLRYHDTRLRHFSAHDAIATMGTTSLLLPRRA